MWCLCLRVEFVQATLLGSIGFAMYLMGAVNQGVSGKTIPESSSVAHQFVCHAARDSVQEQAEVGMLKDGTMPRGLEVIEVAFGMLVERAALPEAHIAYLPSDFAQLGSVRQLCGVVQVLWKAQRCIKPA